MPTSSGRAARALSVVRASIISRAARTAAYASCPVERGTPKSAIT